jgi:Right handed beta helix region
MDSLDNVRERFEALEQRMEQVQQRTYTVERRRRWWRLPWRGAVVVALGLALVLPLTVQAKTFHCNAGDVKCLIDAINQANANGEKNTIRLQAGTYTLTVVDNDTEGPTGLPVITSPLTITGHGAETTIIERDASAPPFRFFMVAASGTLSLKRLTLRGGGGGGVVVGGSAIVNRGTLAVTRSTLTANATFIGRGAIVNRGTLTVTRSTLTANVAGSGGGAISNGGTVTITNSTLAHNEGGIEGGAVGNFGGTMGITATTFAHNTGDGAGAVFNTGTLTVTNSTFSDNTTLGTGFGALTNFHGTLVVINTTFARNVALGFLRDSGAAIANLGTLVLTHSTLADNRVVEDIAFGSALLGSASDATTILQNTLIARNVGESPLPEPPVTRGPDCVGVVTSFGTNLIGDTTGCTIIRPPGVRDLTGDPGLGAFTDNGRPGTGHVPLLPTSQAIDAGSEAFCLLRDQLGQRRVNIPGVGASRCDIGAIEFPGQHDRPHDADDDHDDDDDHDEDLAAAAQ